MMMTSSETNNEQLDPSSGLLQPLPPSEHINLVLLGVVGVLIEVGHWLPLPSSLTPGIDDIRFDPPRIAPVQGRNLK